jgi:hypothetical protein
MNCSACSAGCDASQSALVVARRLRPSQDNDFLGLRRSQACEEPLLARAERLHVEVKDLPGNRQVGGPLREAGTKQERNAQSDPRNQQYPRLVPILAEALNRVSAASGTVDHMMSLRLPRRVTAQPSVAMKSIDIEIAWTSH